MHQSRTLTLPRFSPLTRPGRLAAYLTASLIAFGLFLAQSSTARASTSVTESITTNTTWTKAGSPYDLDAVQLEVKEGATLTIDAGVTVDFNVSEYFFIYGTINAVGTEAEPVVFTSHEGLEGLGQPGQYAGVLVRSKNAKSSFSHTTFRYGGYSTAFHSTTAPLDINEEHTTVAIDHSNFEYSQHFGLHIDSYDGTGIVSNSTFAHNESGIAVSNNSVLDLSRSLIAENTGVGVELIIEWSEIPTGSSFLYNTITGTVVEESGFLANAPHHWLRFRTVSTTTSMETGLVARWNASYTLTTSATQCRSTGATITGVRRSITGITTSNA